MKNNVFLLALISVLIFVSCGPTTKEAGVYSRKVVKVHNGVIYGLDSLDKSFKTFDTLAIEKAYIYAEKRAVKGKSLLKDKIGYLNSDTTLYYAEMKFINTALKVLRNEYKKMFDLYRKPEYTLDDDKEFTIILQKKDEKIITAMDYVISSQENFSEEYNIVFIDDIKKK